MKRWLNVGLGVQAPGEDGFGMHGYGMFIINPPWQLHGLLEEVMPYLAKVLGKDGEGSYKLEFEENA